MVVLSLETQLTIIYLSFLFSTNFFYVKIDKYYKNWSLK